MPVKAVAKKAAAKGFQLPKTLAGCADLLYTTREERLALDRDSADKKKIETKLADYLIEKLPVGEATGVIGQLAGVTIETKPVATVEDWDAVYCYILYGPTGWKAKLAAHKKKSDPAIARFAVLNRAVNQGTVKEMWDANDKLPGVQRMNVKKASCTKRKAKR